MRATRAIIHLDNLRFNINEIKKLIPQGTKICFPVKADGYGHGAVDLAKVALEQGIYCLAVATVDEGIFLRNAGLECPIMLFSLPCLEELDLLVKNDLTPFVFEEYFVEELNKVAKKNNKIINVHIKIDTGMARIGCDYTEVLSLAQKIKSLSNLNLQGLGTHLCVSDSIKKDDIKFTLSQISKIDKSVKILNENDIHLEIVHCAASGGVLMYPNAIFDMIRPGILFYGYFPDEIVKKYLNKHKKDVPLLKPVMELETRIETIKKIFKVVIILFILLLLIYFCLYWYATKTSKLDISSANNYYLYDSNGNLFSGKNENWIKLSDISPYLINATVAIEDKNFYKHISRLNTFSNFFFIF